MICWLGSWTCILASIMGFVAPIIMSNLCATSMRYDVLAIMFSFLVKLPHFLYKYL